jgi:hypothetical protein
MMMAKKLEWSFVISKKAFDRVKHRGLLSIFSSIGTSISGQLHYLFTTYLSNRQQRVVIRNSPSNSINTLAGVPQGSSEDLCYINDIVSKLISNIRFLPTTLAFI